MLSTKGVAVAIPNINILILRHILTTSSITPLKLKASRLVISQFIQPGKFHSPPGLPMLAGTQPGTLASDIL